jgi:hypothetical protein
VYRVIGILFNVEFLGGFLSYHLFQWFSLHIGLSVFFLVSFFTCIFFLAVGSSYEISIHSLHIIFFILKIQKYFLIFIMEFALLINLH